MWHQPKPPQHQQEGFLLTHPVWDVTPFLYIISINPINFYSHIPCGMWLLGSLFYANDYLFLLTHPMWDVTVERRKKFCETRFLLTHPVWDVTKFQNFLDRIAYNFYSHIPCGMWLALPNLHNLLLHFYSHIPCGMWLAVYFVVAPIFNFYSHIPCGMWLVV